MYGVEIQLPKDPNICDPLRFKAVFAIDLDDQLDDARIECCINPLQKHACSLNYELKVKKIVAILDFRLNPRINYIQALTPSSPQSFYLVRQCADGVDSSDHQEIPDLAIELERWLCEQSDFVGEHASYTRSQLIYKYMVLKQIDLKTHYSRFFLPTPCHFQVPIQPGLFKVSYSLYSFFLYCCVQMLDDLGYVLNSWTRISHAHLRI